MILQCYVVFLEISTNSEHQLDANEDKKMYMELFTKQLKPCLQTRELKLIKENGENRYMIITQDDADLSAGNTIVTKNTDGTISLTTVKGIYNYKRYLSFAFA